MTFDQACCGGCVSAHLYPYSPVELESGSYECEDCGTENPNKHICKFCLDEITVEVCEKNGGACSECRAENDFADKFGE